MEFLYKYRDASKNTLEIFINKQIYLPTSSKFNDPFDAQLLPSNFIQELRELGYETTTEDFERHESFVSERLKGYGIYSLGGCPNDILMWSHYANSHKGICIGFNSKLEHHFTNYDWSIQSEKVVYANDHPFKKILEDLHAKNRFNSKDLFVNFCDLGLALLSAALTVKHSSWEYEKEQRIISELNGLHDIESSAINHVIFGMNISKSDEITIRSLLSKEEWQHVKLYRAKRGRAALAIDIVEAN